jgi:hypothetical protein
MAKDSNDTDKSKTAKPANPADGRWRHKLGTRKERLQYLRESERYWYGAEGHGSEKRKHPA